MINELMVYWPALVGVAGFVYGYAMRVSKKELADFAADVENITEDGNISPEETINMLAKLVRIFKE